MILDLTLSPLYRVGGREVPAMPGLLTATPPRTAARGREQNHLVVYLILTGNAVFKTAEYAQVAAEAVQAFYQTAGALTSALRAGAEAINRRLLERNTSTSGSGQYTAGWLTLAALRDSQCTFLLSGGMHVFRLGQAEAQHIFEPALSGKGLGLGQATTFHLSQAAMQPNDQLLFCGRVPAAWGSALDHSSRASLQATRRRLLTLTGEDVNAVLMLAAEGSGQLTLLSGMSMDTPQSGSEEIEVEKEAGKEPTADRGVLNAHLVQPSAYAIPVQPDELAAAPTVSQVGISPEFPASIPRAKPKESEPELQIEAQIPVLEEEPAIETPREPPQQLRQAARVLAGGISSSRAVTRRMGAGLERFLPRLLPGRESGEPFAFSSSMMAFIALLVPILVVTVASTVYLRYGRSLQYETYLAQAQEARTQARSLTDPVEQRTAWENVLLNIGKAESHRQTAETSALKQEAESNLDALLGILRLQFTPAFSSTLGVDISRLAASESDLFLLDAAAGEVLHARVTSGRGFQMDTAFNCAPGVYGGYTVGPLVDILALPGLNSINAEMLGVDASGNLLYCAPGQVAQAIPLPPPDTNWGRVTAMTLDAGDLYVLDAPARAVWVYAGRDGTFIDRPYFFFGGQTPEKQDVIDLAVTGDDLYLLHADGHLSTCSYSRIETVPTRCEDPATLVNPFSAYAPDGSGEGSGLFEQAHFTQMLFTAPPDQSILLLDIDSQAVFRLTPRSLELQNQLRPTTSASNPIPQGPVGAMAVAPNHVLFLAINGQVFFATGMP